LGIRADVDSDISFSARVLTAEPVAHRRPLRFWCRGPRCETGRRENREPPRRALFACERTPFLGALLCGHAALVTDAAYRT
jgi:hypothetical protein